MQEQVPNSAPSPETQPPPEGQPAVNGQEPPEGTPSQPLTAEEVEAQWKHRVSQKDRAHAAAEQALRDENVALQRQLSALTAAPRTPASGQSAPAGDDPTVTALREQLANSQRAIETERQARVLDTRKAKYPALAQQVGDAGSSIFATADEATLARLNALADSSSGGTFAPTSPRRPGPAPAPKALGEMSKAELEDQMRRSIEGGALKREDR
jgi:hypothetical protein